MIKRSKRHENFTVIPNSIMDDQSIDWKALGLLVYLLSKPDHWKVSIEHLSKQRKAGKDAVKAMLKELKESGYVVVNRMSSGHVDWVIFDQPQVDNPLMEKPQADYPHVEKPHVDNPTLVNTERAVKTERESKVKKYSPLSSSFDLSNLPIGLSIDVALAFVDHRKILKAPLTQHAFDLAMAEAAKAMSIGLTPDQVINQTILSGWKGVNLKWLVNQGVGHASHSKQSKSRTRNQSAADQITEDYLASGGSDIFADGCDVWDSMDEPVSNVVAVEFSQKRVG